MKRSLRGWIGVFSTGLAFAIIVLAPFASGVPPVFKAVAPYSTYGGFADHGSVVLAASGTGTNVVVVSPTFNVGTGVAHQSQSSTSSGGGSHKLEVFSGVQNVSFVCSLNCSTGNHSVKILWNLTWAITLQTNCSASPTHLITFAGANISILGFMVDKSASPPRTVGHGERVVRVLVLQTAGGIGGSNTAFYALTFAVGGLTSGHSYTVRTFVQARTSATSKSGCSSSSDALIGSPVGSVAHPSKLVYVEVL
jgi:hypothetical protein